MSRLWYRNAVIYSLDVEVFSDSDGDGIGDFRGLLERLDHLSDLGVTCLWLQPFYPSPNHDDGYDVSDYRSVDPRHGSLDDFRAFLKEAEKRGLRVLIDLVVNHTSIEHPWFKAARSDRQSKYRDYYIWLDEPPEEERRGGLVFPGEQTSNWAYDEVSDSYYWHWFYDKQPDLNTGNPAVRAEIREIIAFWLDLGVSGFRIDAAPFLFKRKGIEGSYPDDPLGFLVELREFLDARSEDAVFLAEADVETDELAFFLGDGERMHLLFNFILNNYFFLAVTRESGEPIRRALQAIPSLPESCQWANFIRNHDELNLDRLSEDERNEVFDRFAPDPSMRIYGRGIRRRLPSMLEDGQPHLQLIYSLLFSLPGAPVLRYGDEIGMGDELGLPGRMSVRTPMQWSAGLNGGFSTASEDRLIRPMVSDDRLGFASVNVEDQLKEPDSLIHFTRALIRTRRECPEIGSGSLTMLESGDERVLAHACTFDNSTLIFLHNLSDAPVSARVDLADWGDAQMRDVWSDRPYDAVNDRSETIPLNAYGYRWLRVG